ncbi:MAG TPA: HAD-IB family phosphatase [Candidatus Sulfomarinibacteraceae bacterium]|nr:HAD-IB family phosphatase [Candidatus Sulfomarinibacteraceae bacterium]
MRWPPYKHVFFDCDSTLTTVEGIDVLARSAGKGWRVEVLTRAAMDGELELEEVYDKRLTAVRPTRAQINDIRRVYKQNIVEDAPAVIAALRELGHEVYIISGGLAEPVIEFGLYLGVPRANIRAVQVDYDELSGPWWLNSDSREGQKRYRRYNEGALTVSDGKAQIVRELLGEQRGRSILVGDGMSDLYAGQAVDLFVGFGGVTRRSRVVQEAVCYVDSPSLAPILPIAAGPAMLPSLERQGRKELSNKSKQLIETGVVTFQDERLREKFEQAYQAVYPRPDRGSPRNT